ncbi:MAG: NAD(P)-binding domain-containing protein [Propionibacteriaceae bacterium]|nr:NAD(P)-binding domain-containing protein [Propionibacteriaceae bacterium]
MRPVELQGGSALSATVCIIGAGAAGLALARALRRQGVEYDHLERHAAVGGLWDIDSPGSPMYESAHFISSRTVSGFSGFDMPADYPDYPDHRQVLAYLRDFACAHGLTERIQFSTEVTALEQDGQRWRVTTDAGSSHTYDAVAVCTGSQWTPLAPGIDGFTGEVRHSVTYRDANEFTGKRVLIVGGGNSACDIACDAARTAASASISMRRGYWFIPKHVFGLPSDIVGGKGSFLPKRVERALLQPLLRLLVGDLTRIGLQKPDHKLFDTHPVLNDQLLHHIRHGDVSPRPGIKHADGQTVTFTDDSSDEFDLILLATGYQHAVPFAQELFGDPQHPDELYLNSFSRRHPGLCAVGFLETNSGAYQLFDRQAHIVAGHIAAVAAGDPRAGIFSARIRDDHPDLTSGLEFDTSPRHKGYVDSDAFLAYLIRTGKEFGWSPVATARNTR